jgi:Zn-finger nucleic acid-binding protein
MYSMSKICPNCSSLMIIANRLDVVIDHCPRCKGVWLDRGELEKITNIQNRYEEDHYNRYHYGKENYNDYNDDYYRNKKKPNKIMGFIGNVFDGL